MDEFELQKKRKTSVKKDKKDKESGDEESDDKTSKLFSELDLDLNSDYPVHEKFVNDKKIRKIRK